MAINPLPFLQAMPDPGQAFMDSFQKARAARLAEEQKVQQKQLFAQMSERVRKDPSPQNLAQFTMAFPQMAEAIQSAYKPMTEERRAQEVAFYGQTLGALQRGNTKAARELVESRLAAARNTPGQEETVKKLEEGLKQFDTDPDALRAGLAMTVQQLDSKLYDTLYAKDSLTGFQKDLQAAGIDPASEEGMAKARQFVELKTDPLVEMQTPDQGKFVGQRSEYYRRYGTGAPPPSIKQPPRIGEVRNGYAFTGGNPKFESNWVKAKPLQDTKAPELGAGGIPSVLTRAQYDAIVKVKGKGETDAWMLRNGVRIGGQ